ncbi:hypothetical protein [Georgenia sp. Z1491]|uniref:hypothetical protein n=1 Tax=Georgenia sp. Z1491 TaxID=3416707 RepID=UPI003CF7F728
MTDPTTNDPTADDGADQTRRTPGADEAPPTSDAGTDADAGTGSEAAAPRPRDPNDPALPPELFTGILKRLVLFLLVVAALSIGIGLLVGGTRGMWGGVIGTGLAAIFAVTTVVAVRAAAKRPLDLMVIAVMGSWLLKTVLVILVLLAVRDADFFHRGVLFGSAAIAVLGSVLIDSHAVMTARIPYTSPPARPDVED